MVEPGFVVFDDASVPACEVRDEQGTQCGALAVALLDFQDVNTNEVFTVNACRPHLYQYATPGG